MERMSAAEYNKRGVKKKPKRSKYKNKITFVDGIRFMSKREAAYYVELRGLQEAGHIKFLSLQPRFPIEVGGFKICTYVADFKHMQDGIWIITDVKGCKTAIYKLKKKLVEASYNIKITEVM